MTGTVLKIVNPEKLSGTGKNGKPYNIMSVEVERDDRSIITADSFDTLVDGDIVDLESKSYTGRDGKTYSSWNAKVPRASQGQSPTGGGELLQAIKLVYKKLKEVDNKVDLLLGPAEPDAPEPDRSEEDADGPARDWQSVGQHDREPLPEPPVDIEALMEED